MPGWRARVHAPVCGHPPRFRCSQSGVHARKVDSRRCERRCSAPAASPSRRSSCARSCAPFLATRNSSPGRCGPSGSLLQRVARHRRLKASGAHAAAQGRLYHCVRWRGSSLGSRRLGSRPPRRLPAPIARRKAPRRACVQRPPLSQRPEAAVAPPSLTQSAKNLKADPSPGLQPCGGRTRRGRVLVARARAPQRSMFQRQFGWGCSSSTTLAHRDLAAEGRRGSGRIRAGRSHCGMLPRGNRTCARCSHASLPAHPSRTRPQRPALRLPPQSRRQRRSLRSE